MDPIECGPKLRSGWSLRRRTPLALLWFLMAGNPLFCTQEAGEGEEHVSETFHQRRLEDEAAKVRLQAIFEVVEEFKGLSVEVREGVAFLEGEVTSWETSERAEELVLKFPEILWVDNRIKATRQIESRLAPVAEKAREYLLDLLAFLPVLLVALLVVLVFWFLARVAGRWERLPVGGAQHQFIRMRIRQGVQALILLVGLALASEVLGITALVGALLGTAGIAGIVLGFAFKDIVENYLAGVILTIRQPFAPNDLIRIGEHQGKVVRLTSRDTVLMTLDGNHLRIPNAAIFNGTIVNFTRNPLRRFEFAVGVGVREDLARVLKEAIDILMASDGVLSDPPPRVLVDALGDSSVTIRGFGWVDQRRADFGKTRSEAIRRLKEAFDSLGIEMPEPAYIVRTEEVRAKAEPAGRPPPSKSGALPESDVSVDTHLEEQIEAERQTSEEENLLE